MAKVKSNLPNMVLTLLIITLVSGGVLGYMYELTKEPIQEAKKAKNNAAIQAVLPAFDNDPNAEVEVIDVEGLNVEIYPATLESTPVGYAVRAYSKMGFSGLVWVMVGFEPSGVIHNVEVLEHQETPGLGTKMAEPFFKDQYKGKNPKNFNLKVTKDGGNIDAITAATISSRAFSDAVQRAYEQVQKKGEKNE